MKLINYFVSKLVLTANHVAPMAVVLAKAILNPITSRAQVLQVPTIPPPGVLQLACSEQALNGDYSIMLIGFNTDVVKQSGVLTAVLSQNLNELGNLANRTNDGVIQGEVTGLPMPTLRFFPRIIHASFDGKGNLTSKEANVLGSTMSNEALPFSAVTNGSYTVAVDCTVTIFVGSYCYGNMKANAASCKYAITGVMVDGGKKIHGIAVIQSLPGVDESVQNTLVMEAERI